jgi:hypothetical protein
MQEDLLVEQSREDEPPFQSKQGDIFHLRNDSDISDGAYDASPGGASSRGTSQEEQRPSHWF